MKHRIVAVLFLLAALAVPAMGGASSVLTPDGIRFAIESTPDLPQVEITRAEGDARARLVVPSTEDATPETQAQLAFDSMSDTLYVVWAREGANGGEIRYATLNAEGHWSAPRNVAAGAGFYRGLQLALTRSEYAGVTASLMHLAWWSINGTSADPEYALFAFEKGSDVTVALANLEVMAATGDGIITTSEWEEAGEPIHPPMAMERNGESIEVVFGHVNSTSITRLNILPRKIGGNVRIWKPVGRSIEVTPRSQLVSGDKSPVQVILKDGRVALYTVGDDFSYVVLKSNNTWTTLRTMHLDEDNASADLVRDLRAAMEEISEDEEQATEEVPDTH